MSPRILITRSPHQASTLADQLRAFSLEPILIPTIELAQPSTFAPLDAALAHLDHFHWLIFTSANAVEAFTKRLQLLRKSPNPYPLIPDSCLIAAIGPATARALEAANLPVHLLPPQALAESLTEKLLPHARQTNGTPTRFLLPRAELARELLPDTLRAAGADVTIAPVYCTIVPTGSIAAIRKLFLFSQRAEWPAAITFTSSSTATNLIVLLDAAGLTLPGEILRVSIGPITSRTLCELNLPPHAEATQPNIPGLVAAVVKALRSS